jgi:hypothetical protein
MKDISNPIDDEIWEWAYSDALEPMQDFDLILATELRPSYLEFVADSNCTKRNYFLKVLYLIVGDAVRTAYHTNTQDQISSYIEKAKHFQVEELTVWANRSRDLMNRPEKFDYDQWCAGGLVDNSQT